MVNIEFNSTSDPASPALRRLWDTGQRLLGLGRYAGASRLLAGALELALRQRDATAAARICLPLLEARRQLRQRACEGVVCVLGADRRQARRDIARFLDEPAGTLIGQEIADAPLIEKVAGKSLLSGLSLEALLIVKRGAEMRVATAAAPTFAMGVDVTTTAEPAPVVAEPWESLRVPLPPPGWYAETGDARETALRAMAMESLLLAWEALGLKWLARHQAAGADPFEEIETYQQALNIDPASEPILIQIMAKSEAIATGGRQANFLSRRIGRVKR